MVSRNIVGTFSVRCSYVSIEVPINTYVNSWRTCIKGARLAHHLVHPLYRVLLFLIEFHCLLSLSLSNIVCIPSMCLT